MKHIAPGMLCMMIPPCTEEDEGKGVVAVRRLRHGDEVPEFGCQFDSSGISHCWLICGDVSFITTGGRLISGYQAAPEFCLMPIGGTETKGQFAKLKREAA